jgi:phage gpG-like protein
MTIETNAKDVLEAARKRLAVTLPESPQFRRKILGIMRILNSQAQLAYLKSGLKRQTGFLANSLFSTFEMEQNGVRITLSPRGVKYARIHEFGGIIRPKEATALRFQIGDKWITTKKVTIPARPYLRPTLIRAHDKIMKLLAEDMLSEKTNI